MNIKRLEKLISFMSKLPKSANKHFDMLTWFEHTGDHVHPIGRKVTREALRHCGTSACALGWAATIPSFQKAGFTMSTRSSGTFPLSKAQRFFDLSLNQAEKLFIPVPMLPMEHVSTPKQWAKTARRLVREWQAE